MNNICLLFQQRWNVWRWWCLAIVIAIQTIYMINTPRLNDDEQYQLGVSHAIKDGHNQSIKLINKHKSKIDITDPGRQVSLRQPPGYALMYSSLISPEVNPVAIDLVIDLSATLVFLFAWFLILENIGPAIGVGPRVIFWMTWLIFPASLVAASKTGHSTGLMTVALFSVALAAGIQVISIERKARQLGFAMLTGLAMGVAALLHYEYWVLAGIFPFSWLVFTYMYRRSLRSLGRIMGVCAVYALFVFIFIIPVAVNNFMQAGRITRANPAASDTINLEHLGYIIHFPVYALGFEPTRFYQSVSSIAFDGWSILTILLLLVIGWNIYLWARQTDSKFTRNHQKISENFTVNLGDTARFVIVSGVVTTLFVTCFLALMSIQSNVHGLRGGWVPLAELRYYLPVFPFFLLGITLGFSEKLQLVKKQGAVRILRVIAAVMLLIGLSPQLLDRALNVGYFVKYPSILPRHYLMEYLQSMASASPRTDIVIFSNKQNWLRNTALAANLPAAQIDRNLGFSSLRATTIMFYSEGPQEKWILDSVQGEPIKQVKFRKGVLYQYNFDPFISEVTNP